MELNTRRPVSELLRDNRITSTRPAPYQLVDRQQLGHQGKGVARWQHVVLTGDLYNGGYYGDARQYILKLNYNF